MNQLSESAAIIDSCLVGGTAGDRAYQGSCGTGAGERSSRSRCVYEGGGGDGHAAIMTHKGRNLFVVVVC